MVVESARLVKGQDEQRLVPLGAGSEGVVDGFDQDLTVGDEACRVHGAGSLPAAGWVDETELGQ